MIVLLAQHGGGISARRVGLVQRIAARWHEGGLDRDLADGAAPESSTSRAVHADRLARPAERRQLASYLLSLEQAAVAPPVGRSRVPMCRDRVRQARTELDALAERLSSGGPIDVRGVAMTRVLLSDGNGPVFQRRNQTDLRVALRAALAALEPSG
jgi:hypothetical protein